MNPDSIKEGGPAFPTSHQNPMNGFPIQEMAGMTLRDYFAAKAMAGFLSARHPDHSGHDGAEQLAQDAYMVADEMLAARGTA